MTAKETLSKVSGISINDLNHYTETTKMFSTKEAINAMEEYANKKIRNEFDFVIANMQHGTSYVGKSKEEIENHEKIIYWLEERRKEFTPISI